MPEPIVTSKAVALLLKKGEAYVRDGSVIQGPWKELQTADSDVDPIEPTGQAAELMRKRMIKEAFREPNLKLDDLLKERCIVMWRIIRKMGEYFGYPSANTSIAALFRSCHPLRPASPADLPPDAEWTTPPSVVLLVQAWSEHPLPLLTSDQTSDEDLDRYIEAYTVVAEHLNIHTGSLDNRNLGRYGLRHLVSREFMREAAPTPYHLVAIERQLTESVMSNLLDKGSFWTAQWLRTQYDFSDFESSLLMDLGRKLANAMTSASEDENRALMQLRLEDIYRSSFKSGDYRVGISAAKTLAVVQGLTRGSADDDAMKDLERLIHSEVDADGALAVQQFDDEDEVS